jgi:hypothetical protein
MKALPTMRSGDPRISAVVIPFGVTVLPAGRLTVGIPKSSPLMMEPTTTRAVPGMIDGLPTDWADAMPCGTIASPPETIEGVPRLSPDATDVGPIDTPP